MRDFRNLTVWKKSHELVLSIYKISKVMPRDEQFGLITTLRRTAMAIPLKLAEACGQSNDELFRRSVWQANTSSRELDYALLLSRDLQYLDGPVYETTFAAIIEVQKMLYSLSQAGSGE